MTLFKNISVSNFIPRFRNRRQEGGPPAAPQDARGAAALPRPPRPHAPDRGPRPRTPPPRIGALPVFPALPDFRAPVPNLPGRDQIASKTQVPTTSTADVSTQMFDNGSVAVRIPNPDRPTRLTPSRADAQTQTQFTSLSTLPNETLQHIIDYAVEHATARNADRDARSAPMNLALTSRRIRDALLPQLIPAQVEMLINQVNTVNDIAALLGTPQQPGRIRRHTTDAQYEQALVRFLIHAETPHFRLIRESAMNMLLNSVAQLPPDAQARVLTGALRDSRANPCVERLLGSPSPHAPWNYNIGTVRALPPNLQAGPLRAAVDYGARPDIGVRTEFIRGEISAMVNSLPQGIGDDLKARVANF